MKLLVKNIALFISLSIFISMFAGCSTTSAVKSPVNNNNVADNKSNLPKSEYPSAPVPIMQAQITKPDGAIFKLEDYKGKVILVNLWAIWCGPCKAEMPEFIKLKEEYKEKGFEIIGLNVGDTSGEPELPENIISFSEQYKLNYTVGQTDDKIYHEFLKISKVDAIPQSFLIDREGKLVGVFVGGGKNVEKIKDSVGKIMNS